MLRVVVEEDVRNAISFWKLLNHEKRCMYISQLEEDDLLKIYLAMKELQD